MIVIIDYGTGNTGSILNMIRKVGYEAKISNSQDDILSASVLILPGVGAFDNAIKKFNASGLRQIIEQRVISDKIPFLGICLGMQLIFEASEEGSEKGLGWVPGKVKRFDFKGGKYSHLKTPHMGWNIVKPVKDCNLFDGLKEPRFYFVHSYYVSCDDDFMLAVANYGHKFVCSIQKDNIYATQFHPEKSHKFGIRFFKNFLETVC